MKNRLLIIKVISFLSIRRVFTDNIDSIKVYELFLKMFINLAQGHTVKTRLVMMHTCPDLISFGDS